MLTPPFRITSSPVAAAAGFAALGGGGTPARCEASEASAGASTGRARLADLDPHLHCSIIGTCLSTAELRKLMARFIDVREASDLVVHHEAVGLCTQGGAVAKALGKALDQRHDAAVQRSARARDPAALAALWDEALRQGDIPGAYWAVLTHRSATPEMRQRYFGDVHMLSHLVGAANRADIRRLVALERENVELRDRLERQQVRAQEWVEERDRALAALQQQAADAAKPRTSAESLPVPAVMSLREEKEATAALVALHTERRERAEQATACAVAEARRLSEELEHLGRHVQSLSRELAAAETQLCEKDDPQATPARSLEHLRGRRILYVGGRPSSMPAIRDLVLRHGGAWQHHDGGLEDRKGMLAAAVAWADRVVFPVDCIDHDSAGNLKRLCAHRRVAFTPVRSASVASFAAALANPSTEAGSPPVRGVPPTCIKHG